MIHGLLDQIQPCVSDDEDDQPDVEFTLSGYESSDYKTLVICGPGPASAFALQVFALRPLSWCLKPQDSARAFPPLPKSPKFFEVSDANGVVVVLLEAPVAAEYAVAWAEKLLLALEGAQVLVLDRILRSEWCSPCPRPEEPHLAGLWTSCSGRAEIPALPAPNIVQGLAAAVIASCEARSAKCTVALTLQDGAHLSEGCLQGFEVLVPLLQELQVIQSWQRPNYREAVQKVVPPAAMSIYA
mmetsp:Transcript_456/g.907  ORF Transcript_456/g.907 Transcript_456/m.907 type:complete len:242 (+) Transcript_456:3-728(+)